MIPTQVVLASTSMYSPNSSGSTFSLGDSDFSHPTQELNNFIQPPDNYTRVSQPPPRFDPSSGNLYTQRRIPHQFQSSTLNHSLLPPMAHPVPSGPSLGELLAFPAVQELYNDLAEANRRVARALDTTGTLQQEILRLSSIVQSDSGARYINPSLK